jgi:hypothetical protein
MNRNIFQIVKKYTNKIVDEIQETTKWMPFPNEFYQKIYKSLLDKENSIYNENILIQEYDMLMDNIFSFAVDEPPGFLWAAILQNKNNEQPCITTAAFTEQGNRVGKLYLMQTDNQLDKDLMLAFQQFPILIMPARPSEEIPLVSKFGNSIPSWGGSILTYTAAIKYFVNQRSMIPNARKGVLNYEKFHSCVIVQQGFLDSSNNPICNPDGSIAGRECLFGLLDQELKETLAGEKMLVVG